MAIAKAAVYWRISKGYHDRKKQFFAVVGKRFFLSDCEVDENEPETCVYKEIDFLPFNLEFLAICELELPL